jgi:hypothetical protein
MNCRKVKGMAERVRERVRQALVWHNVVFLVSRGSATDGLVPCRLSSKHRIEPPYGFHGVGRSGGSFRRVVHNLPRSRQTNKHGGFCNNAGVSCSMSVRSAYNVSAGWIASLGKLEKLAAGVADC